jgi:hypothetical protein
VLQHSAVLSVGVAQAALGFLLASLGACLILLARDLTVPRTELSWLSAGFGVALLVLGLAGARLLRLGAPRVLRLSAASLALGAVVLATAWSVAPAEVGALLLGAGGAGIVLVSPALLTGPQAARAFIGVNAASSIAGVSAPLLVSATDALTGHGRLAMLLPAPPLMWLVTRAVTQPVHPASLETSSGPAPRRVLGNWISIVAVVSPEFAFVVWGAARLQDSGLTPTVAAAAAAAFPIGMGAGRLIAPHLVGRAPLVTYGLVLAAAAALGAAAPVGPVLATIALAVAGLGIAPLYPMMLSNLVGTPGLGLRHGAALGAVASGTAVLCAPPLLNVIARRTSLHTAYLAILPALLFAFALQARTVATPSSPRQPEVE